MHETIMQFPSDWFYHGELEAAPEVRYRGILDFDTPMNWIDTSEMDFHEDFVGESFGRINKQEANLLLQELETYIGRIGKERILDERIDFGLISPYKAQVQYLRGKIKGSSFTPFPQPHHREYGRRLSGTGARRYFHQSRTCQRGRTNRVSK